MASSFSPTSSIQPILAEVTGHNITQCVTDTDTEHRRRRSLPTVSACGPINSQRIHRIQPTPHHLYREPLHQASTISWQGEISPPCHHRRSAVSMCPQLGLCRAAGPFCTPVSVRVRTSLLCSEESRHCGWCEALGCEQIPITSRHATACCAAAVLGSALGSAGDDNGSAVVVAGPVVVGVAQYRNACQGDSTAANVCTSWPL